MSGPLELDVYLDVLHNSWFNSMFGLLCTTLSGFILVGVGVFGLAYFSGRPRPTGWILIMVFVCGLGVFLSCSFSYRSFCLMLKRREDEERMNLARNNPDFFRQGTVHEQDVREEEIDGTDVRNILPMPDFATGEQCAASPEERATWHRACAAGRGRRGYRIFKDDSRVSPDVSSLGSSDRGDYDDDEESELQFKMDDIPCRKKRCLDVVERCPEYAETEV